MKKNPWILLLLLGLAACSSKSALERSRTLLKKINPAASIKIAQVWQTKVGNGNGRKPAILAPVVNNQVVYANAEDGTLKAINIRNGKSLWHTRLGKSLSSGIGRGTGSIYVASNSGQILGVSKQNGKLVFKSKNLGTLAGTPAGRSGTIVARTLAGKIFGLNLAGNIIWQQEYEPPKLTVHTGASTIFYGNNALIGLDDGSLMAINYTNGAFQWLEPIAYAHGRNIIDRLVDVDATPILEGNHLYAVSFHGNVAKLDAANGTQIWSTRYSSVQSPVIIGKVLILTHEEGLVTAFNKTSGIKLWEKLFLRGYDLAEPAVYGRYVAVGIKNSNVLFWLDSISGKVLAKSTVPGKNIMSIKSSDYGVVVYAESGDLSLQKPR